MPLSKLVVLAVVVASMGGAPACTAAETPDAAPAPGAGVGGDEGTDDAPPTVGAPSATTTPGASRLIAEAERIVAAMKVTSYAHTTNVDEATGTVVFDCSGFVDYALARAVPEAFTLLAAATLRRPLASSYVSFVSSLDPANPIWQSVATGGELVAGDIVAWLKPSDITSTNTGHVMIVSGRAVAIAGGFAVPVIDSSETGHGPQDPRALTGGPTGLGRGTIVLLVDERGAPTGYRWSTEAISKPHTTKVVLAHLR